MVERSSQSLWKIIAGHSAIQNTDLILSEVKANEKLLSEGLGYFRLPSSVSETKLKSSKDVTGKKLKFVQEISQKLLLDQVQSLQLFKNFLLEGYCGSFQDINTHLSNKRDQQSLLVSVEEYYYKERLYALRCVKQFLGYWQDASHPYRVLYDKCVQVLDIATESFISGVWKQFDACINLELPSTVKSLEEEKKWLQQVLLEQCELLEILLLFHKDFEFPVQSLIKKLKLFQKIGFGYQPRGHHSLDMSNQPLVSHISYLCTLLVLEAFDLEWLQKNQGNKIQLQKHRMYTSENSKSLENLLQDLDYNCSYNTPLLLGWSVLCYMTASDESGLEQMRHLGCRALQGNVFEFIMKMLSSHFLTGDRPVAGVCKSTISTLVSLVVTLFNEESLGDPQLLLGISSKVLTHPRLRIEFWENEIENGLGVLLVSALKRMPFETEHVFDLLLSLSQDESSAHRVYLRLSKLNWYTEECTDNMIQATSVVLEDTRVLFEREYKFLGLLPLEFPPGTKGFISNPDTTNSECTRTVCWEVKYSAWNLFAVQMVQLLHTPGIGLDLNVHPLIDLVAMNVKLAGQVLKFDWSVATDLKVMTSQVFLILQRFSSLPHPPVSLIAACVDCLTVMAENEPMDVWHQLVQTGFLPQIVGAVKNLQVSCGHYAHILNVWERAHGRYPVTVAILRLILSTLKSCDSHVITESVLATIVYILQTVFVTSQNWRYDSQKDREEFCHQLLQLCYKILENGVTAGEETLQNLLHEFTVDLLLHSSGHVLLINNLAIGVTTVNSLTASSHNWCQTSVAVESLKISFKVTDILLQRKKNETITPLEQALATRTVSHSFFSISAPQHIITSLASYIHHHDDPAVPEAAVRLLTGLATVAPMSMFSCLGQEAVALRDKFVTRLSARTESTSLRIAILGLITVSMETQPGLLELFLSLKRRSHDSKSATEKKKGGDFCVDSNSILKPVLDMIDPAQQKPMVPPSLLSAGMHLLRTLWEGRHVAALNALTSTGKFWEHLMKPLYEDIPLLLGDKDDQQILGHKLCVCAEIFHIIAMELYYVIPEETDKELKSSIDKFVSEESYKKWCQVFQAKQETAEMDTGMFTDEQSISLELIKVQYKLAEAWRAFLLVASTHHESLCELHSDTGNKRTILQELLMSLEVQTERLPLSLPVVTEILSLYLSLLKKWTSVKIPGNVVGRFTEVLAGFIRCDNHPNVWQSLSLIYSCLIYIVTSLRRNEEDLQIRFTLGLLPLVVHTLTHHTHYLSFGGKHLPEVYAVYLLSELTWTLLLDDDDDRNSDIDWLCLLRDHSLVMISVQACIGHTEGLSHPDLVNACLSFFLSLAMCQKGCKVLLANNVFQLLNVSLCVVVEKLKPDLHDRQIGDVRNLKELLPSSQWLKVWLSGLKLVSNLLCTQGHYVIDHVMNFVGAHADRLLWVLDIFIATRFMETLEETECVCQFFNVLVAYRQQWRVVLMQQHNMTIERLLNLFNGAIAVLSRDRIKDLIKNMDSQGLLPPEQSSAVIKAKASQSDNDSWVKISPAYLQLRERLLSIVTSCLTVLNNYSPSLNDLFMCSFTQPLDLLEWPLLFHLVSNIPVLDPTCPPSINTLTTALNVGCEMLKKSDPALRSVTGGTPFRSPSKFSPIKSPVTPGLPRIHSAAGQQKRMEILFMLEQAVVLLMSQSLRYIVDDQVDIVQKQALKKQLVSELGNFCQVLLLNFHRKGAPSPRSLGRVSLSSSRQTLQQDSSSGRASSHSFSDGPEQGLFKLVDLFYKSKILT